MQVKVQVITRRDDGEESLQEVACVERDELTPASLGVSIADSKAILQGIQTVVVEWQMHGNRSGCQNITLVITSADGVPCGHGHAPLIATGTLGTDSA
jgi:hypothetical protein